MSTTRRQLTRRLSMSRALFQWMWLSGRAALHAEHRPERGLAQADHRLLADAVERVAQAHRGGGLALAGRRRVHRRDQDQPAVRPVREAVDEAEVELGLVRAMAVEAVRRDVERGSDLLDRSEAGGACNLEVDLSAHRPLPLLRRPVYTVPSPHQSAMNSAIAWVLRRTDSRFTRSSKPWIDSDLGP
jgi:hypothetical protein